MYRVEFRVLSLSFSFLLVSFGLYKKVHSTINNPRMEAEFAFQGRPCAYSALVSVIAVLALSLYTFYLSTAPPNFLLEMICS